MESTFYEFTQAGKRRGDFLCVICVILVTTFLVILNLLRLTGLSPTQYTDELLLMIVGQNTYGHKKCQQVQRMRERRS